MPRGKQVRHRRWPLASPEQGAGRQDSRNASNTGRLGYSSVTQRRAWAATARPQQPPGYVAWPQSGCLGARQLAGLAVGSQKFMCSPSAGTRGGGELGERMPHWSGNRSGVRVSHTSVVSKVGIGRELTPSRPIRSATAENGGAIVVFVEALQVTRGLTQYSSA